MGATEDHEIYKKIGNCLLLLRTISEAVTEISEELDSITDIIMKNYQDTK